MEPGPDALAILRRSLQRAEGFALFFAVVESPAARERWIARLRADLPETALHPVRLTPDAGDLLAQVRSALAAAPTLVLTAPLLLLDLELLVPHEAAPLAPLFNLNLQRQAWREELPRPLVFWIAPYLAALIARAAPDFFDWRRELLEFPAEPSAALGFTAEKSSDLAATPARDAAFYRQRLAELDARLAPDPQAAERQHDSVNIEHKQHPHQSSPSEPETITSLWESLKTLPLRPRLAANSPLQPQWEQELKESFEQFAIELAEPEASRPS